jgi:FkbM family methyltransferase
MLAFINEDVGRIIWLTGIFEPDETRYFQREIRPTDICLDVGGNVGYMAMLFAATATQGQVHVFEPIEVNAALVRANASLNQFPHVIVNNMAVGANSGTVEFSISQDTAYSSMRATGRSPEVRAIEVPIITLDDYTTQHGINQIDILKVDVEGAEELVLRGAERLLSNPQRRPRIVLLELFDTNLAPFQSSVERCISIMTGYGYKPNVTSNHNDELIPYTSNMANRIQNIIFIPAE